MIVERATSDNMVRLNAPMRALACETPKRVRDKGFDQALITYGSASAKKWNLFEYISHKCGPGLGRDGWVRKNSLGFPSHGVVTLCIRSFRTSASGSRIRTSPLPKV